MRPAQSTKPATYTCPFCRRRLHAMSAHMLIAPEGDAGRRRHAHTECVLAARKAGSLPTYDDWRETQPKRRLLARLLPWLTLAFLAGCGSSTQPAQTHAASRPEFAYDRSQPLDYVDHGRISSPKLPVTIDDVSFRSGRLVIEGYLVRPKSTGPWPGVVVVHGSGGDRAELLEQAKLLAARGVVALTITEPSTSHPPPRGGSVQQSLESLETGEVRDVVAIRRAVDVLQSLPHVDAKRIGYLGWSAGGRAGTFVAASEPRVKALALLSAGAAPVALYAAGAPAHLRPLIRRTLTRLDPIHYLARARPGSVLLEDGRRDRVVPHFALMAVANAAPHGTTLRWFDAPHELNDAAYRYAFAWLAAKLRP
jgi:dienelactone hydrolase